MPSKISARGSALLLEMLIVVSIVGVLFAMSAPSFLRIQSTQQSTQAVATLRAVQNAEAYYLQIYRNGYVAPGTLAGNGVALAPTCDAPLLLGGAQAQPRTGGYSFQFVPGPNPADLGVGCTTPGSTTFSVTATPVSGIGRSFFMDESGVLRYSDSVPANNTSPAWVR